MAAHFFCPGCWKEIGEGDERCPHCGYALEEGQGLSYEQKLIRALGHPIRENRMMAARILGELKSQAAVPALGSLLGRESDYYVIREVVVALRNVGGSQALRLIDRLRSHPSRMVRRLSRAAPGNDGTGIGRSGGNP